MHFRSKLFSSGTDFSSKHKQFGCVKPNKSGQMLVNIAKDLKLFYVNQLEPNRHTREDPVHGYGFHNPRSKFLRHFFQRC